MGILPFRDSGFLDGVWRPSSEDSSPDRDFRSCRFGIGLHRSMDGPEPSGEDLREFAVSVAGTSSTRDFHRFKGPRGGRWYGLEPEIIPLCRCFVHLGCILGVSVIRVCFLRDSALIFKTLGTTPGTGPRQVFPCFQNDDMRVFMIIFFSFSFTILFPANRIY